MTTRTTENKNNTNRSWCLGPMVSPLQLPLGLGPRLVQNEKSRKHTLKYFLKSLCVYSALIGCGTRQNSIFKKPFPQIWRSQTTEQRKEEREERDALGVEMRIRELGHHSHALAVSGDYSWVVLKLRRNTTAPRILLPVLSMY